MTAPVAENRPKQRTGGAPSTRRWKKQLATKVRSTQSSCFLERGRAPFGFPSRHGPPEPRIVDTFAAHPKSNRQAESAQTPPSRTQDESRGVFERINGSRRRYSPESHPLRCI